MPEEKGPGPMHSEASRTRVRESEAMRETAATRIGRLIEARRREAVRLEALLKVAERAETGSPLEEALWEMACRSC